MDTDRQRPRRTVDDTPTDEFVIPAAREQSPDLVLPTAPAAAADDAEARRLVAAALKELEASGGDGHHEAWLHLLLGLITERRLGDERRAVEHYLEARRLCPSNVAILRTARRLFWSRQNWAMVLALIDEELAITTNPGQAAQQLLQKARICEERLASTTAATTAYMETLKREPGNHQALLHLRRILRRQQNFPRLVEICRQAAAATQDRRQRGLLLGEVASIIEEHLADGQQALEVYAAAYGEDPANASVCAALKRLYRRYGRWGDLVEVLLTEADLLTDERERVHTYLSVARICRGPLGQHERALELLLRARSLVPKDPLLLEELADLLQQTGRFRELADVYRQRIECLVEEWERVTAHYRLGQVLEERLGDEEEALFHYRRAVALDPTYVPALQALGRVCQRRGEWAELVTIGAAEAELIQDASSRASRFCALAEVCQRQLNDPSQAIEFHRRALAGLPHFPPAEHALEQLYSEQRDWEALIELLECRLELPLEATERGQLLERIARLCEEQLGDGARAMLNYRRALEAQPAAVPLMRALQRLCARAGRWGEVVDALDREIARTSDERLRIALMHRAAEICEVRLSDLDQAVRRYRELLNAAPAYSPNLQSFGRVLFRLGKWDEVIALYRSEVQQPSTEPSRKSSLLYKVGEIYQERLNNEVAAITAYRQALEATPRFLPALQALAGIYRRREQWDALVEVLERQAEVLTDPARKAFLYQSIGELYEAWPEQRDQAIRYYRLAVERCASNEAARNALLRLLADSERWREVVAVYEQAIAVIEERSTQVTLLKALAEVWDRKLLDPARATTCYEQVLTLADEDLEALDALSRLYRRVGAFDKLVEVHEKLAAQAADTAEAVGHLYEAASVVEAHLPARDPSALYQRVVQLVPSEVPALEALCRSYGARGELPALARVFDELMRQDSDASSKTALLLELAGVREATGDLPGAAWALGEAASLGGDWVVARELSRLRGQLGQWEGVAESLERAAALSRDVQLGVEDLLKASHLYLTELADSERAASALAQLLERDPFHEEAASRLEQLLVQREAWKELVDVLRRRLEVIAGGARPSSGSVAQVQIELLARMAWIQREHLKQPLEAVGTLNRSLQIDPHHLDTLVTLGELHLSLEQWKEAVDVYSRIVAVSNDPDVLRMAHFRLGDLWSERLGDSRRAISSYQNVQALAATDTTALRRLFDLFVRNRDWENAADMANRLIEFETEHQPLIEHYLVLAEIQEKGFGDPYMATTQLQRALAIDPSNERVLNQLTRLQAQLGDWEGLVSAIRSFVAALPADQENRGIVHRLRLGEVLRQQLNHSSEALEQYQAVVEIDPTNVDARLATASILVKEGRLDEALAQHREVQALDPLNLESLAQMRAIWARLEKPELAYAAAGALVCLGRASNADEALYRERHSRGTRYPQGRMDSSVFETVVVHPDEHPVGRRILAALGEAASRIRPPRFADWHVGKAERLPMRSDDPLRALVGEVTRVLGLDVEPEVYLSPVRVREMDLLLTDTPALVTGSGVVASFSALEVRFWIGQLLSYVRNRTWIGYGLSGAELSLLVRAACRVVDPKTMMGSESDVALNEMTRLIQRNVSRRARKELEEACPALVATGEPNYDEWARAMRLTAMRAGLYVVNDLETALGYLERTDPALAEWKAEPESLVSRVRQSTLATALIQYWVSEEFNALQSSS